MERIHFNSRVLTEEKRLAQQKLQELQAEVEAQKHARDSHKDVEATERELKKLQEKYREAMAQVYQHSVAREHLEASLRMVDEEARAAKLQHDE